MLAPSDGAYETSNAGILMFTFDLAEHYALERFRRGARDDPNKDCDPCEIVEAARTISVKTVGTYRTRRLGKPGLFTDSDLTSCAIDDHLIAQAAVPRVRSQADLAAAGRIRS